MAKQVFTHDKKECCLFYVGASPHTPGVYRFTEGNKNFEKMG